MTPLTLPLWAALLLLHAVAGGRLRVDPAVPDESPGSADPDEADYVEYRFQPELGQINVYGGLVRGGKAVRRLTGQADALARKGIFGCVGDRPQAHTRTDRFAGHAVETVVTLTPPPDPGDPEAAWSQRLLVTIDGRKKVDCSLSLSADTGVVVYGVTLHLDEGLVELVATDDEGHELIPADGYESFDDPRVITDQTFVEPPELEVEPVPETQRV